jgi:hypothetical protein
MTMNSPDALTELFSLATSKADKAQAVQTAELMREIGLKCIGFNGVCYVLWALLCLARAFNSHLYTGLLSSVLDIQE